MLQVILGVIRCISDFQKPCASKTAGLRVKHTSRSLCYPVLCIVFHLVKQSAKPLGFLLALLGALRYCHGAMVRRRRSKNMFSRKPSSGLTPYFVKGYTHLPCLQATFCCCCFSEFYNFHFCMIFFSFL